MLGQNISLLSSNPSKDLNMLGSNLGRPLLPRPEGLQDNIPEGPLTRVESIRSRNEF
jgi:hypothetical protein